MTRNFGFAIVGGGVILPWHAAAISALPNARLVAIVDADQAVASARAAEFGIDGYTGLDAVLARADVDVVAVCVPSGLHAQVGVRVAEAGKHLVVEKPIEVSLAAADRLIDACRASGVGLTVISQHRYDPGIERLHQALAEGRLGRLLLGDAIVKWYRTKAYYESAGWRGTRALDGGGSLMNQAVHYVDLLRWLMGPVRTVLARSAGTAHELEVEDLALAIVGFESGALGTIQASTAVYPGLPERLEVTGTEGTVIVENGQVRVWELKAEKGETGAYGAKLASVPAAALAPIDKTAGHRRQLAAFLEALETGSEPPVTGEEARATLELVLAVYQSAATGAEVRLPLPA